MESEGPVTSDPKLSKGSFDPTRDKLMEVIKYGLRNLSDLDLQQFAEFTQRRAAQSNQKSLYAVREQDAASPSGQMGVINLDNIERVMAYQNPTPDGLRAMRTVREALTFSARTILQNAPQSPSRDRAILDLIHARMEANMAISFHGQF